MHGAEDAIPYDWRPGGHYRQEAMDLGYKPAQLARHVQLFQAWPLASEGALLTDDWDGMFVAWLRHYADPKTISGTKKPWPMPQIADLAAHGAPAYSLLHPTPVPHDLKETVKEWALKIQIALPAFEFLFKNLQDSLTGERPNWLHFCMNRIRLERDAYRLMYDGGSRDERLLLFNFEGTTENSFPSPAEMEAQGLVPVLYYQDGSRVADWVVQDRRTGAAFHYMQSATRTEAHPHGFFKHEPTQLTPEEVVKLLCTWQFCTSMMPAGRTLTRFRQITVEVSTSPSGRFERVVEMPNLANLSLVEWQEATARMASIVERWISRGIQKDETQSAGNRIVLFTHDETVAKEEGFGRASGRAFEGGPKINFQTFFRLLVRIKGDQRHESHPRSRPPAVHFHSVEFLLRSDVSGTVAAGPGRRG